MSDKGSPHLFSEFAEMTLARNASPRNTRVCSFPSFGCSSELKKKFTHSLAQHRRHGPRDWRALKKKNTKLLIYTLLSRAKSVPSIPPRRAPPSPQTASSPTCRSTAEHVDPLGGGGQPRVAEVDGSEAAAG